MQAVADDNHKSDRRQCGPNFAFGVFHHDVFLVVLLGRFQVVVQVFAAAAIVGPVHVLVGLAAVGLRWAVGRRFFRQLMRMAVAVSSFAGQRQQGLDRVHEQGREKRTAE